MLNEYRNTTVKDDGAQGIVALLFLWTIMRWGEAYLNGKMVGQGQDLFL